MFYLLFFIFINIYVFLFIQIAIRFNCKLFIDLFTNRYVRNELYRYIGIYYDDDISTDTYDAICRSLEDSFGGYDD